MAPRRVKTPVAGPDFSPVQALPVSGRVTVLAPTTDNTGAAFEVGAETTCIQILTEDAAVYVATESAFTDEGFSWSSAWKLLAPSYATYGVAPESTLVFRAVTGTASVRILEA